MNNQIIIGSVAHGTEGHKKKKNLIFISERKCLRSVPTQRFIVTKSASVKRLNTVEHSVYIVPRVSGTVPGAVLPTGGGRDPTKPCHLSLTLVQRLLWNQKPHTKEGNNPRSDNKSGWN